MLTPGEDRVISIVATACCLRCRWEQTHIRLAEVTSEVYDSGDPNWPHRVDISYLVNPPLDLAFISMKSAEERDLVTALRQAAYIELTAEEYRRAETRPSGGIEG